VDRNSAFGGQEFGVWWTGKGAWCTGIRHLVDGKAGLVDRDSAFGGRESGLGGQGFGIWWTGNRAR
jgi:hypothetical protein